MFFLRTICHPVLSTVCSALSSTSIHSMASRVQPIYTLPIETLCEIFLMAQEVEPHIVLSIIQVSRRFREVAQGYPKLWKKINLRYKYRPFLRYSAGPGNTSLQAFCSHMRGDSPRVSKRTVDNLLSFLAVINSSSRLSKARSIQQPKPTYSLSTLDIQLPHSAFEQLYLPCFPLPQSLEVLRISMANDSADFIPEHWLGFPLPSLPRLRELKLGHITPFVFGLGNSQVKYDRLEVLHVESCDACRPTNMTTFLKVLSSCAPTLVELSLFNTGVFSDVVPAPAISASLPLKLPKLKHLKLTGDIVDLTSLLNYLDISRCDQLDCTYLMWFDWLSHEVTAVNFPVLASKTSAGLNLLANLKRIEFTHYRGSFLLKGYVDHSEDAATEPALRLYFPWRILEDGIHNFDWIKLALSAQAYFSYHSTHSDVDFKVVLEGL
ncbi:hypothetical protein K474DRAFT_945184 [Panus rudis PR-1116 ss-1]|nr:hypothetical protein K474DRAFT_945184 [Panus rudis PR-1116 ss-1]